jgi:hypothetical protein
MVLSVQIEELPKEVVMRPVPQEEESGE